MVYVCMYIYIYILYIYIYIYSRGREDERSKPRSTEDRVERSKVEWVQDGPINRISSNGIIGRYPISSMNSMNYIFEWSGVE